MCIRGRLCNPDLSGIPVPNRHYICKARIYSDLINFVSIFLSYSPCVAAMDHSSESKLTILEVAHLGYTLSKTISMACFTFLTAPFRDESGHNSSSNI